MKLVKQKSKKNTQETNQDNSVCDFIFSFNQGTRWLKTRHEIYNEMLQHFKYIDKNELLDTLCSVVEFNAEQKSEWTDILYLCVDCANFLGEYNDLPSLSGKPICGATESERICTGKIKINDPITVSELMREEFSLTNDARIFNKIMSDYEVK